MKITDKSFAVRVAGHLFIGKDIMKISIDGTDFEMEYGWCSNGEATVKCKTKDVEFLNIPNIPEFKRTIDRDKTPNTYDEYFDCRCRHQFTPYYPKEYTGKAYCKVGNEPKSDVEVVYPLSDEMKESTKKAIEAMRHEEIIYPSHPMHKEITEILKNSKKSYVSPGCMPCFKDENMEPTASEEALKKAMEEMSASMKTAGESINKGLKAMAKFNEPIKVDLSIDGKQLQKMIKTYSKTITRSGG